jgi:prepilin-type N-terminal cleavage/methylation domain-containing protein
MRNERGFTLVEALVASVISLVIATVAFTIFDMHNRELSEGSANMLLQRQYEGIANAISASCRRAFLVLADQDGTWSSPYRPAWPERNTMTILMYDTTAPFPAQIGGFRINGNFIEEWKSEIETAEKWKPFTIGGGDSVHVVPDKSNFGLSNNRDRVTVNLTLTTSYRHKQYTLSSRGDLFRCRNERHY